MLKQISRVVGVVLVALVGGCSTSSEPPAGSNSDLAKGCTANSDCISPLICTFSKCHSQCEVSRDCPPDQRCVKTGEANICQFVDEAKCTLNSQCKDPLVCAIDLKCRNQCNDAKDCLRDQVCTNNSCADPLTDNLDPSGMLPDLREAGAGTGGSTAEGGSAGGADSGTAPDASVGTGGAGGAGGSAGTSADAAVDTSVTTTADAAPDAPATCVPGCQLGKVCSPQLTCVDCGSVNAPCCSGNVCDTNLSCNGGTCKCGGQAQKCCGGTSCDPGFTCGADLLCSCGANGAACCANKMCATSSLDCAGRKCTCVTGVGGAHLSGPSTYAIRSDGSVWNYTGYSAQPTQLSLVNAQPFVGATKVVVGYYHACALKSDKTVWCWSPNPASAPSYGQLGNGDIVASANPVQVVTNPSGPEYLTNVVDIAVNDYTTCAATGTGGVYCWGYGLNGELGNNQKTSNSKIAVPVQKAGGTPLGDADQVSVGGSTSYGFGCAHTTGGIFCWGNNSYGQLGQGDAFVATESLQAVQVSVILDQATQVSAGYTHVCARMNDTNQNEVLCWGENSYHKLGDATAVAKRTAPALANAVSLSGTPLTGILQIWSHYYGACAVKAADHTVWCWGYGQGTVAPDYFPKQLAAGGFPVDGVRQFAYSTYNGTTFVDFDGVQWIDGYKVTHPVACP